jgi:hypothetical protein
LLLDLLVLLTDWLDSQKVWHVAGAAPLSVQLRREIARHLENAARKVRRDGIPGTRLEGGLSPDVQTALAARRDQVLGWLNQTEARILWPDPEAPAELQQRLISAIVNICRGDWTEFQSEPSTARISRVARIRRWLPRLALSSALLAAAWAIPTLLGDALSASAADTLRVSLTITGITALIAPTQALTDAVASVRATGGKPPG